MLAHINAHSIITIREFQPINKAKKYKILLLFCKLSTNVINEQEAVAFFGLYDIIFKKM